MRTSQRLRSVCLLIAICAQLATGQQSLRPFIERGRTALDTGKYQESVEAFGEALDVARQNGESPNRLHAIQCQYGWALVRSGRGDDGERQITEALAGLRAAAPSDPIMVSRCASVLGVRYRIVGKFAEAEAATRESLALVEGNPSENSLMVANTLINLSSIEHLQGFDDKAYATLLKARELLEKRQFPRTVNTANFYLEIGLHERIRMKFFNAITYYEKALRLQRDLLGPGHPDILSTLTLLAEGEAELGRTERADEWLRQAADLVQSHPADPTMSTLLAHARGVCLLKRGDYKQAAKHYQSLLSELEKHGEPTKMSLARTWQDLGRALRNLNRAKEAVLYHEQALRIFEAKLPAGHADIAAIWLDLAEDARVLRDYQTATFNYRRGLAVFDQARGVTEPRLAGVYAGFAKVLRRTGNRTEAEQFEARANQAQAEDVESLRARTTVDASSFRKGSRRE